MHRFPKAKAIESTIERAEPTDVPDMQNDQEREPLPQRLYQGMSDYTLAAYLEDMQERAEIEQLRRTIRTNGKLTATDLY
ncbi:hypothetical protein C0Q88_07610 [Ralstonia pickettii]|uniref:Uncharacterized protein n=1 Tax=Ralstonia pickettii TaxID=329 RepID=A0A2N4TXW3_RALPI|nr:hypothetical protein [Ralstonia pickettii]PLC44537.1 hypothetical protein C0Q88_07610 [Ralstonia pickettii]